MIPTSVFVSFTVDATTRPPQYASKLIEKTLNYVISVLPILFAVV